MCCLSAFLVLGGTAGVLAGFVRDVPAACAAGAALAVIVVIALACTAWRDPGIVQRRQEQLSPDELYDDKSMTFRPRNAIFEHETGVIIEKVDHFCPWTGTVYVLLPCLHISASITNQFCTNVLRIAKKVRSGGGLILINN